MDEKKLSDETNEGGASLRTEGGELRKAGRCPRPKKERDPSGGFRIVPIFFKRRRRRRNKLKEGNIKKISTS